MRHNGNGARITSFWSKMVRRAVGSFLIVVHTLYILVGPVKRRRCDAQVYLGSIFNLKDGVQMPFREKVPVQSIS